MMRTFSCAAAYSRHVADQMERVVAEVCRDTDRREDEDPRVQALAWIDPTMIDPAAKGRIVVVVMTEAEAVALAARALHVA